MNLSNSGEFTGKRAAGLPWRQWILLPIIGLLTILLLAVCTELAARMLYPVSRIDFDKCFVIDDLSGQAPIKPNGLCRERVAESKLPVEYRFDSRGNRADGELTPKPPDVYRIVMIGSSMAMGLFVPQEKSFAALLPAELSRRTGRKFELYNEATGGKFRGGPFPTHNSVKRFQEVFAAQPDMILWAITPMDIENAGLEMSPLSSGSGNSDPPNPNGPTNVFDGLQDAMDRLQGRLRYRWDQTRTSLVLKHLLLENESQDQYVNSYLKDGDDAAFLKMAPGAKWQHSYEVLKNDAEQFASQTNSAGVALVAVLIPNRAQAAMISRGEWPDGFDPYKLGNMLRSSIESDGGTYLDILPDLRAIPNPEQHYFPVDGHLDVNGHEMIADILSAKLAGGELLGTRSTAYRSGAALAQGR